MKASVVAESVAVAVCGYVVAAAVEAGLIRWLRPTEWELAWISDVVLAMALGVAVYLWRSLRLTRETLAAHQRAELVLQTQLSVAADIQRRLLPSILPDGDGLEVRGGVDVRWTDWRRLLRLRRDRSARLARAGGRRVRQGIPAAMALGSLRSAFRTLARAGLEPAQLITQLSSTMYEKWRGSLYVTCIVAAFDLNARTLVYTNAGHPVGVVAVHQGLDISIKEDRRRASFLARSSSRTLHRCTPVICVSSSATA